MVLLRRVVYMRGRVKNDHHHPPQNHQEGQRSLFPPQSSNSVEMWILWVWGAEQEKCLKDSLFAGWREERAARSSADDETCSGAETKCELVNMHTAPYTVVLCLCPSTRFGPKKDQFKTNTHKKKEMLKSTLTFLMSINKMKTQPLHKRPTGQYHYVFLNTNKILQIMRDWDCAK